MSYTIPMINRKRHGKLRNDELPPPCIHCRFRHTLEWMLGVPFCFHSSYTCVRRTKACDEFEGDYGTQLELF